MRVFFLIVFVFGIGSFSNQLFKIDGRGFVCSASTPCTNNEIQHDLDQLDLKLDSFVIGPSLETKIYKNNNVMKQIQNPLLVTIEIQGKRIECYQIELRDDGTKNNERFEKQSFGYRRPFPFWARPWYRHRYHHHWRHF